MKDLRIFLNKKHTVINHPDDDPDRLCSYRRNLVSYLSLSAQLEAGQEEAGRGAASRPGRLDKGR
jgi:hypothetical protein